MLPQRLKAFGCVCFGITLAGGAFCQAASSRVKRAELPSTPIYSKDSTVVVYAPASKARYRAPVLVFVDRTREELSRATRLKLGSQLCPLEVAIGSKSDGDTRVLTARLRDAEGGGVRERIELPDPEAADLALFRRGICVALLRAWMVDAGGTDGTMRDVPAWLIDGVVRYMDREGRQADVDRSLALWSRACLPPAAGLLAADSLAATREPAVAALLAGWFLERRNNTSPFESLLRGAATGTEWSVSRAGLLLAGTDEPLAFDDALDRKLLEAGRLVLKPGLTTEGIVKRFRAHLLLYPADYGKSMDHSKPWCTFHEVAALSGDFAVRGGALLKVPTLKMAAVGRDGMLLAVAEAYVSFLEAVARGERQGELTRLLLEAEGMRGELERKTSQGAVLQRSLEAPGGGMAPVR